MKHLFFSILLACSSIHATVIEIQYFNECVAHLTKDTLFLVDIDDTLLVPKQMLGSDAWFEDRIKQQMMLGLSPTEALKKTLNEWEGIRHFTEMQLVEPGIEKTIQDLQKKAYVIMGLSTQSFTLSQVTSQQLSNQQINLKITAPCQNCYFQNENTGVLFTHGILFTSGTSKGNALFQLLEVIGKKYNRIVFINDKASHLADVEEAARKKTVEFIGLRYGYSDFRKKAFDSKISTIQLEHSKFTHILSDAEAKIYLQKNT